MSKVTLGPSVILYPLPTVLVGANVDGKPDFVAVAWCGVVNSRPPMISVSLQHSRHSLKGIRQNGTFSINIPSVDYVNETDYCGMVSGADTDKAADCKFDVFYGKLGTAPLIEQMPVNIECRVFREMDLGSHVLIIGQLEEVYATAVCLTDGKPDVAKIRPFLWAARPGNEYYEFGKPIGKAFASGAKIKPAK
jgi:flavin reductase (DIM6/NTAB) family NADH-FMN oxidoreductase RutF